MKTKEEITAWIKNRIEHYRGFLKSNPEQAAVYNALISELETIRVTQLTTQPEGKPLSEITLDDLTSLVLKYRCHYGYKDESTLVSVELNGMEVGFEEYAGEDKYKHCFQLDCMPLVCFQYLQSKGYRLPKYY